MVSSVIYKKESLQSLNLIYTHANSKVSYQNI